MKLRQIRKVASKRIYKKKRWLYAAEAAGKLIIQWVARQVVPLGEKHE